jgi:hypothetical protein
MEINCTDVIMVAEFVYRMHDLTVHCLPAEWLLEQNGWQLSDESLHVCVVYCESFKVTFSSIRDIHKA